MGIPHRHLTFAAAIFALLSSGSLLTSCTQKPLEPPQEAKYISDTDLMVNICAKFAHEPDSRALNKVAVATQLRRIIVCADYNNECTLYGKFLQLAIDTSADGNVTGTEREEMARLLRDLRFAVEEGKKRLHEEWKARRR